MIIPTYAPTATERVLPRLALDFTTSALDPRVTVTRALDTATRINSNGFVEIVNANLPRFDYDPTTLACRGLLIEESRANLLAYSNTFNDPIWTTNKSGGGALPIVTAASGTSPDGTNNAYRVQFNAGGTTSADFSLIQQIVTGLANPHTGTRSLWMKSYDGSTYQVALRSLGALTYTVFSVGPIWTRVTHTDTSSTANDGIQLIVRGTYGTSTTADILVYGAQFEIGAFATSYIPTTTTSLTRNADVVSMTGTNLTSWLDATQGTLLSEHMVPQFNPANTIFAYSLGSSAGVEVYTGIQTTGVNQFTVQNTTNQANFAGFAAGVVNVPQKVCGYFKENNFAASANGSPASTDTLGTVPSINKLIFGARNDGARVLNGWARKFAYWPFTLTTAEVTAFSKQ